MITLPSAAALDSNFGYQQVVYGTLLRFYNARALPTSPRNWRCAGPRNPQRLNLRLGRGVWGWCGASPLGIARWIRGQRFHLKAFSVLDIDARPLISITMRRSIGCFAEHNSFGRQRDFAPTRLQPFSVCWR